MKATLASLAAAAAFMFADHASAEQAGKVVRTLKWSDAPAPKGTVLSKDGETLIAANAVEKPLLFALLSIESPGIGSKAYAVRCKIKYSDVSKTGYLETWNVFPPTEAGQPDMRAFTRTMGSTGPMSVIQDTSDWRPAVLPFNSEGAKGALKKIELNLFLPGKGRVEIKEVELVEFPDAKTMFAEVERMATAMMAPSEKTTETAIKEKESESWRWSTGAKVAAGVAASAIVASLIWAEKKRRAVESRRMKAMDAL